MCDLLLAIKACHERGVIYRDVKHENVPFGRKHQRGILIDFDCSTIYVWGVMRNPFFFLFSFLLPENTTGMYTTKLINSCYFRMYDLPAGPQAPAHQRGGHGRLHCARNGREEAVRTSGGPVLNRSCLLRTHLPRLGRRPRLGHPRHGSSPFFFFFFKLWSVSVGGAKPSW